MAVEDHGIQVLSKSAEEVSSGSKANYYLKTSTISGFLKDAQFDYAKKTTTSTTDTWTFRSGGASGTITRVIVITYTDSTKAEYDNIERTV